LGLIFPPTFPLTPLNASFFSFVSPSHPLLFAEELPISRPPHPLGPAGQSPSPWGPPSFYGHIQAVTLQFSLFPFRRFRSLSPLTNLFSLSAFPPPSFPPEITFLCPPSLGNHSSHPGRIHPAPDKTSRPLNGFVIVDFWPVRPP